jgi:hypothetical protein
MISPTTGIGAAPVVIAQANATPIAPMGSTAMAAPSSPAGLGSLSNATPGTVVMRDGVKIPVDGSQTLMAGDRVMVPDGGHANVLFPGSASNKAPLAGVFTGGTDATIGSTKLAGGLEQVNVDVASGDLQVTPPDSDADAAALAVTKKLSAGSGIGLGEFALGALGAVGLAAALGGGGGGDSGVVPMPIRMPTRMQMVMRTRMPMRTPMRTPTRIRMPTRTQTRMRTRMRMPTQTTCSIRVTVSPAICSAPWTTPLAREVLPTFGALPVPLARWHR